VQKLRYKIKYYYNIHIYLGEFDSAVMKTCSRYRTDIT